jgi:hypothetical protein
MRTSESSERHGDRRRGGVKGGFELAAQLSAYSPPPPKVTTGVLGRYGRLVGSGSDGASVGV